jgi:hypothetical protein
LPSLAEFYPHIVIFQEALDFEGFFIRVDVAKTDYNKVPASTWNPQLGINFSPQSRSSRKGTQSLADF